MGWFRSTANQLGYIGTRKTTYSSCENCESLALDQPSFSGLRYVTFKGSVSQLVGRVLLVGLDS
jgi:hypothetical protein